MATPTSAPWIAHQSFPFTNLKDFAAEKLGDPNIVETGEGVRITNATGKANIDGFAGLYCVNIGYGRTEETVGAFIAQSVLGTGGIIPPPAGD